MRQINCYIPIRVSLTGGVSEAQLEELSSTLVDALTSRLEFAERTIASHDGGRWQSGENRILRADYDPLREDVGSAYRIPSYNGDTKSIPIRRAGPAWFIRRTINFKAYVGQFLEVFDSVKPFPGKELYAELDDELRWVSAWLVQVNREFLLSEILDVLHHRVMELGRVRPRDNLIMAVASYEAFRQQLIKIDQSNVVATQMPILKQEAGRFRGTGDDARLLPGARLLQASMVLPRIELKERANLGASIQITVSLRDLTFLVNPIATSDRFKARLALSWDEYLKEYGDRPERVHVHPVTVRRRTQRGVLKLLVEDALTQQINGEMSDETRLWGDLYLLNNATLTQFPPLVRAQAGNMTNDLTRTVDQSKTYGDFEPNWAAAYVYTILKVSSKSIYIARYRPSAAKDADRLIPHISDRLVTVDERWRFMEFVKKNLYGFFPPIFEVLLDELKSRDGGAPFNRFFSRVKEAKDYDLRLAVIRAVKETKYANDPSVLDLVNHHNRIERSVSTGNVYDVAKQQIILNKLFGDVTVSANAILYQRWSQYVHEEKRYKPKGNLAETWEAELLAESIALIAKIEKGDDAQGNQNGYTDEEFAAAVLKAVFARKNITEDNMSDFFDTVTIQISVRFLGLKKSADELGIETVTVSYQIVERESGGSWNNIGEVEQASDSAFDAKIDRWIHEHVSAAIITIAHVALAIAAIGVAWEFGVLAPLMRLAGGAKVVIPSIILSTIYELIVHGFTFESFLFGAINGYLGALFFRGAGGLARGLFGRSIATMTFRDGLLKWIGVQVFKGTIGGGTTGAGLTFARDVYNVATGRGGWSSPADYAKSVGFGAALGVGAEFAGPLILEPIGARVFASAKEVGKLLLANEVSWARLGAWTVQAQAKLSERLAFLLENQPGKAATIRNGFKMLYEEIGEAYASIGRGIRGRIQLSVYRQLLEFSGAELTPSATKGLEKFLKGSAAHLTEDEALGLVKRMFATPGRLPQVMETLNLLDEAAISRMIRRGELDGWLLVLERDVALDANVLKGLNRLFTTALPKDVLDDLIRLAPKNTLPELLGFIGSLEQGVVEELAVNGYLGPLSRSPRVLAFVRQPGNLDALRRIVRGVGKGRPTAAAVDPAVSSVESLIENNPRMTAAEIEAAATPRRKLKGSGPLEKGETGEETTSSRKKDQGRDKPSDPKAEKGRPVRPPIQRNFVNEYERAAEAARNARNEVRDLRNQIANLPDAAPGGKNYQTKQDLKEALEGAEQTQSIENANEINALAALQDSTLALHEKLGAVARNRAEYLNIKRLAKDMDMVGNFKVELPDTVHPDHIVAIRRLTGDPKFKDFLKLHFDDQVTIANLRDNLVAMKGEFNLSKGDRPWRDWPQARQYYPNQVDDWILKEAAVEKLILDKIAEKLGTAK